MSLRRLLSVILIFSGVSILTWLIIIPVLSGFFESTGTEIISPQSYRRRALTSLADVSPSLILKESESRSIPEEFFITIKKLGIERARVYTDLDITTPDSYRERLKKGLGHVAGTVYPGEWGVAFILGHSALPIFYSPTNYETIFSKLNDLTTGDVLEVEFGGSSFNYRVDEKKVVGAGTRPEDVLSGAGSRLVLMTCFPPGFTFKRLLINALLQKEGSLTGKPTFEN
jgi:LPXTG-site transpeptidase (sortase) family protein